jgi:hypothetical protein
VFFRLTEMDGGPGIPSNTSLKRIKEEPKKLHTKLVIHEEDEEGDSLGVPMMRRKLSTCDRTAPLNGRKSVDLRRSNIVLNNQEERMPSSVANLINNSQRRRSQYNRQSVISSYMDRNMQGPRASTLGVIPDNMSVPRKSIIIPDNMESADPQKMQGLINRRLTMEMKTPMNKLETKRIQVYKYLFTGCIITGLLLSAGSVVIIMMDITRALAIVNTIIALLNVIPSIFVLIVPRLLFSKQHMNKINKLMRLQNLRNAFLLKEVNELNEGLRNNGWDVQ